VTRKRQNTEQNMRLTSGAQPGGGAFAPRNFQNIAIAILTFEETFK